MTDLANMGSLSSKNWNVKYSLHYIPYMPNILGLTLWLIKKAKTVLNGFSEIVNESHQIQNKLWVEQRRTFYNKIMKK